MRFVSYEDPTGRERAGLEIEGEVFDLEQGARRLGKTLAPTMGELLQTWPKTVEVAAEVQRARLEQGPDSLPRAQVSRLLAPVPHPTSCRDGYAFRQHVATARRNRGVPMIPEFDQFPVFYFTNHLGIVGPGEVVVERDHLQQLDFELEAAVVVGRGGRNVPAERADEHIAGLMVMNDFSARVLQMEEMKLNLGPAKGKDFATALGPWLVTLDELEPWRKPTPRGSRWDLAMTARHNGKLVSEGNLADMDWTFAELIERASYGVELRPGDVIGSGTVGTGCYLELNGTAALRAKEKGEPFVPVWLKEGDVIELEIARLGALRNVIVRAPGEHSLLAVAHARAAALREATPPDG